MFNLLKNFPSFIQYDEMDCGPSCLHIVSKFYGKNVPLDYLRIQCDTKRTGTSMMGIKEASEHIGFEATPISIGFDDLNDKDYFPCILHWNQNHFVVLYKISNNKIYISDPACGLISYTKAEFDKYWSVDGKIGVAILLEPQEKFYEPNPEYQKPSRGISWLLSFYKDFKSEIIKIILLLTLGSVFQFIFPFITKQIVDVGIVNKNLNFIYLILLAQLAIFIGRLIADVFRNYLILNLSTRININILNTFFKKLMRLPSNFFDAKMTGDILQRINDHQRIETFLSSATLNFLFSILTIIAFSIVLASYNLFILLVFAIGSLFYFIWFWAFMKPRAVLDYKRFHILSENQEKNIELIYGMNEIKLNNAEETKRIQWQILQEKMLLINQKILKLQQIQTTGAFLINEIKNIVISFLSAMLVIKDGSNFSLGTMMAITYIIGQLNSPILQILEFLQNLQDTKLSLNRISEIHTKKDEQDLMDEINSAIPDQKSIVLSNVNFKYINRKNAVNVLEDINIEIEYGKITAIVGSSGSGKTTLLKLLLRYYLPNLGSIKVGDVNLQQISYSDWRDYCGAVLQDGFIFSETIENNIVLSNTELVDKEKLNKAIFIANLQSFIDQLPMGLQTKIGQNGNGISAGQKQRILIARAVYKNPKIIFFDEATSSLDTINEKQVWDNLQLYFKGKTILVVAHRLSTVKKADKIIVIDNGKIIEQGSHRDLVNNKKHYYHLIKNQLDLEQ